MTALRREKCRTPLTSPARSAAEAASGKRSADHDGLDPHAVRRNRYGEVAGAILPNQVKYLFNSCHSVADELRERLLVAVGRGDVGEAYGPRRVGGAAG